MTSCSRLQGTHQPECADNFQVIAPDVMMFNTGSSCVDLHSKSKCNYSVVGYFCPETCGYCQCKSVAEDEASGSGAAGEVSGSGDASGSGAEDNGACEKQWDYELLDRAENAEGSCVEAKTGVMKGSVGTITVWRCGDHNDCIVTVKWDDKNGQPGQTTQYHVNELEDALEMGVSCEKTETSTASGVMTSIQVMLFALWTLNN